MLTDDSAKPAAPSTTRKFSAVTFREFAALAQRRHWSAQDLAARFRGRIDSPLEFFNRVLSGKSPDSFVPYRSVIEFFASSQVGAAPGSARPVCSCGCGQVVFDRKKWATPGCRKRAQRKRVADEQVFLSQLIDFAEPRLRPKRLIGGLPLTESKNANLSR